MNYSLKCANPNCKNIIPIPAGVIQVSCSSCNTWHFPTHNTNKVASPILSLVDNKEKPSIPNSKRKKPVNTTPKKSIPKRPNTATPIAYLQSKTGQQFPLKKGKNTIGRRECDLIFENKTISRQHCVIEVLLSSDKVWEFYIYDYGYLKGVGSTNGVLIEDRSLRLQNDERLPIRNGTNIQMGTIKLVLIVP